MEKLEKLEEVYQMGFITGKEYEKRLSEILAQHPELEGLTNNELESTEDNVSAISNTTQENDESEINLNYTSNLILNSFKEANWDESVSEDDILDYLRSLDELPISALFTKDRLKHISPLRKQEINEYQPPRRETQQNYAYKVSFPTALTCSSIKTYSNETKPSIQNEEIIKLPDIEILLKTSNNKLQPVKCTSLTNNQTLKRQKEIKEFFSQTNPKDYEELCLNNFAHLKHFPNQLLSHPWTQLYHLEMRNCSLNYLICHNYLIWFLLIFHLT